MGKMTSGYIKLYREIVEKDLYKKPSARSIFIHLLLTVNLTETCVDGITVPVGGRIASLSGLSKELGMSLTQVRTGLRTLLMTQSITQARHSKFSVIVVQNWSSYQSGQHSQQQCQRHRAKVCDPQQNKKKEEEEEIRNKNSSPSDDWIQNWKANI